MKTFLTVSALALVLASSCQNGPFNSDSIPALSQTREAKAEDMAYAPASDSVAVATDEFSNTLQTASPPATGNAGNQQEQPKQQKPPGNIPTVQRTEWNKKIIKNATLELKVKDFKAFNNHVLAIAGKYGGYIAEENQQGSDYKIESKVSIRVPVELFDPAVNDLTGNAEKIYTKSITSKVVTGEVVDIRSRLEAKRQARLRYLELMKQAKNMEEVFQVQKEVDEIQEEMEAAAGRMGYLSHAAAYSTIDLTFFQVLNPGILEEKERAPSFGTRILDALSVGFKWLGDLLVLLITLWPLLFGAGVLIYVFKKRRAIQRAKAAAAPAVASVAEAHKV